MKRIVFMKLITIVVTVAFLNSGCRYTGNKDSANKQFIVNFSVDGEGGRLTAQAGVKNLKNGAKAAKNTEIVFTAYPAAGFKLDRWIGLKEPHLGETSVKLKLIDNINVKVKFLVETQIEKNVGNVTFKMIKIEEAKNVTLGGGGKNKRTVSLSSFYIGETEVTQDLYNAVMNYNPSDFNGGQGKEPAEGEIQGKRPVEQVSWFDAVYFCNKLTEKIIGKDECVYIISNIEKNNPDHPSLITNAKVKADFTKKGFRLPTEAEWEWAAKGGKDCLYSGANTKEELDNVAWYNENADSKTHQTGKKEPNAYGLYDMSGNVWEWCWDWYTTPMQTEEAKDPKGPDAGEYKADRGGCWGFGGYSYCNITARQGSVPDSAYNEIGLRLVFRPY